MKLLKASLVNIEELRKICIQAYSESFWHHWINDGLKSYLDREFSLQRLEKDLEDEDIEYYVITSANIACGFIKINHFSNLPNLPKSEGCEIEKIYVLNNYKGRGIGKFAITETSEIAKARGKTTLFLCVIDSNSSAISFYSKLGFQFHSKTKLEVPDFKEELRGMDRMYKLL